MIIRVCLFLFVSLYPILVSGQEISNWVSSQSKNGAIEFLFPSDVQWQSRIIQEPNFAAYGTITVNYITQTTEDKQNTYLIRYNDRAPGIFIKDDTLTLRTSEEFMTTQLKGEVVSSRFEIFNGYNSLITEIKGENQCYYLKAIVRGNRTYMILQQSLNCEINKAFFDGIKFIPFDQVVKNQQVLLEGECSISAPTISATADTIINSLGEYRFYGRDDNTGTVMVLNIYDYSPYDEVDDVVREFRASTKNLVQGSAKIIDTSYNAFPELFPAYRIYTNNSVNVNYLAYGFVKGKRFYDFVFYPPSEIDNTEQFDQIIRSLKFEPSPTNSWDITSKKLSNIMEGLASNDSTTFALAAPYFEVYSNLVEEDLDILLAGLQQPYQDDKYAFNTKYHLVSKLYDFGDAKRVDSSLRKHYMKTQNATVKQRILELLSNRKNKDGFDSFFNLTKNDQQTIYASPLMFQPFKDSLDLYSTYFDQLVGLLGKSHFRQELFAIHYLAHYDSTFNKAKLRGVDAKFENALVEDLDYHLANYQNDSTLAFPGHIFYQLEISENDALVDACLKKLKTIDNPFIKFKIIEHHFLKGRTPEKGLVEEGLGSVFYYDIIRLFLFYEKLDELDVKWKNVDLLSAGMVQYFIYENEGWLPLIELGEDLLVDKEGKLLTMKEVVFFYNDDLGNRTNFLALAGPFYYKGEELIFSDDYFSYFSKVLNEFNYEEQKKQLIEYVQNNPNKSFFEKIK